MVRSTERKTLMTVNPYQRRLEAELDALRNRRVNIRNILDAMAKGCRWGGDNYDQVIRRRELEIALRGTQPRWEELHYLLGRDLPGPAVRLNVPVSTPRRGVVKINTGQSRRLDHVRKVVESGGYLTRAMGHIK
jgi:hypothetical protein